MQGCLVLTLCENCHLSQCDQLVAHIVVNDGLATTVIFGYRVHGSHQHLGHVCRDSG